jgi:hypothetical protein
MRSLDLVLAITSSFLHICPVRCPVRGIYDRASRLGCRRCRPCSVDRSVTFVVIGLLSVPPTWTFLRWRRDSALPTDEAVTRVRRYSWIEVLLFPLLPAFAAAMARGHGS